MGQNPGLQRLRGYEPHTLSSFYLFEPAKSLGLTAFQDALQNVPLLLGNHLAEVLIFNTWGKDPDGTTACRGERGSAAAEKIFEGELTWKEVYLWRK